MKVKEIIKATNGRLIKGNPDIRIENFSIDSRTLRKGDLFIAIKGKNFDGHNFVEEAVKKGAIGVVVSKTLQIKPRITIRVEHTRRALGRIAHHHRMQSKAAIIGITGSNGKTITKDMIGWILKRKFSVLSTQGTENNAIGVPLALLRLKNEKFCALEMGMNHLGEIDYLADIARPHIGIITNVGPSHLAGVGDLKDVFSAKSELLNYMNENNTLMINGDDPYLSKIKTEAHVIKFGLEKHNDIRATSIEFKDGIWNFFVNEKYNIQLNLLGRHNIYNALAAIAVSEFVGLDIKTIQNAIREFKGASSRLTLREINGIKIIDDTYNSNPLSLRCAIETLAGYKSSGKKILVSGDMLELGKMSQHFHESIADIVKTFGIDILITVGRHSYSAYLAAKKKGMNKNNLWHFDEPTKAAEILKGIVSEGDLVLIKGSRAMRMEDVIRCFTTCSIH